MADKRVTPARPDLAADFLKGQVDAARFVPGRPLSVVRGRAPLRNAPAIDAEQQTELLHGEVFTVYESQNGWSWGQAALDGYVGYVHTVFLCEPVIPTHKVCALSTPMLKAPMVRAASHDALPMNALVRLEKLDGDFARTDAGFVAQRHLVPLDWQAEDFVAVAERFAGTPYVWGGKSHAGLDCSGLIQTALQAAGRDAPRDTDMMEKALGHAVDGNAYRRGDLVFWKGHMGVMLDEARLLHANAFHMEVAVEPLADAVARIAAAAGPITSVRRL